MKRCALIASFVAALTSATGAAAQESVDAPVSKIALARKPKVLWGEASGGIGTPLGWLGGSIVARPTGGLALFGGAGLGTQGIQLALGGRAIVLPGRKWSTGLGLAWSTGAYAGIDGGYFLVQTEQRPAIRYWQRAHMANVEVSVEPSDARARQAHIRLFAGLGVVAVGDSVCLNTLAWEKSNCGGLGGVIPYLGVAGTMGVL